MVFAEKCADDNIVVKSINIKEKAVGASEIKPATIDENEIKLNIKLSEVGDYIQYKIVVENNTSEDYEFVPNDIVGNSDYLDYKFINSDGSNVIKSGKSKEIQLRVQYSKEVADSDFQNGKYSDSKELVLNVSGGSEPKNPKTGHTGVWISVLALLLSLVLSVLALRSGELNKIITSFILVLLIPIGAMAICKYEINVVSTVEIEETIPDDPTPDDPTPDDPVPSNDIYVYTYNFYPNECEIGSAIPSNIQIFNSPQQINKPVFLRHKIVDGIITESSVGFMLNGVPYYVIGAGATLSDADGNGYQRYNLDSIYYDQNRGTLISAFGDNYCNDSVTDISCSYNTGSSRLRISAYKNGNVYANTGCSGVECVVSAYGHSSCDITPC